MDVNQIDNVVKKSYEGLARAGYSNFCCNPRDIYSAAELTGLPKSVLDLSSGCGNPVASAGLQGDEVLLDIGSGGGIDLFLSARKMTGRVIGVDASKTMIERASQAVADSGLNNIEFRLGDAKSLPVESRTIDVVISNCVIAMIPEKERVYAEIYRVLKPGGRLLISDVIADGELPDSVRQNPEAWARCVVGIPEQEYLSVLQSAGFERIEVVERKKVPYPENVSVLSLKVRAFKPAAASA